MSNERDNLHFENMENIYEQLTKVINAKNDIKANIRSNTEELKKNRVELENLEEILHEVRVKITANPILKKLNITCEQDVILLRDLAESVYSELHDISPKLDKFEENFAKLNEDYNQTEKFHISIEDKFEKYRSDFISSREKFETQIYNSEDTRKKNLMRTCDELKKEINTLSEKLSQEEYSMKSISLERENKLNILRIIKEMNGKHSDLLIALRNLGMKSNNTTTLELKQVEVTENIAKLVEKSNEILESINKYKEIISSHRLHKMELLEKLKELRILSEKKTLICSIQKLKLKSKVKQGELSQIKEIASEQKIRLQNIYSELESCRMENEKISADIIMQKNNSEIISNEKKDLNNKKTELEENLRLYTEKMTDLVGVKNEIEVSIKIGDERKLLILDEVNKIEEDLRSTGSVIEVLNEQISNIQFDINNSETVSNLFHQEIETENALLDTKIKKYLKAIEAIKKIRAASSMRKKNFNESSDSEDSMLIPKKKNKN